MKNKTKKRARQLLKEQPVIDAHCDTILSHVKKEVNVLERNQNGHVDIPRLRDVHTSAQFFACWITPEMNPDRYAERVYFLLDSLWSLCEENKETVQIPKTTDEITTSASGDVISIIPSVEGGHAIQNSLKHLRNFARLGVRSITLTWMNNNEWADGSGDEPEHNGLTQFGRHVVREMNDHGMLVDVSHTSRETFRQALDESRAPVIASHSCCNKLHESHRNLTDEQLQRLSDNGGVVGICYYPGYLDEEYARALEQWRSEQEEEGWISPLPGDRRPFVPLDTLIDHIVHAVDVAGVNHVGLGSDFDGVEALPGEMDDCRDVKMIVERLIDRGLSDNEIRKILGENMLRVLSEAETVSRKI